MEISQPPVVGTQGNLRNCRWDPKAVGILYFGNVKKNRKGDHLRVAKPEGPPYNPLLGHA